jgi:hypothetical protein
VPTAALNAVQGSGGAFVTIATPPNFTTGMIYVMGRHSNSANLSRYAIPYVSGSGGIALGLPAASKPAAFAEIGSTTARMTFQASSFSIQAKGENATAPDSVYVRIDAMPIAL